MIVLAPGSLYTSIIPNLLVDGMVEAIQQAEGMKVYVCNVMTEDGETEGYTVSDHIRALFRHSAEGLFGLCLTNSAPIPRIVAQRYAKENCGPVFCDETACRELGVELIQRPIATVENGVVRHNPGHLAAELIRLYSQRTIRVAEEPGGAGRNRLER